MRGEITIGAVSAGESSYAYESGSSESVSKPVVADSMTGLQKESFEEARLRPGLMVQRGGFAERERSRRKASSAAHPSAASSGWKAQERV